MKWKPLFLMSLIILCCTVPIQVHASSEGTALHEQPQKGGYTVGDDGGFEDVGGNAQAGTDFYIYIDNGAQEPADEPQAETPQTPAVARPADGPQETAEPARSQAESTLEAVKTGEDETLISSFLLLAAASGAGLIISKKPVTKIP